MANITSKVIAFKPARALKTGSPTIGSSALGTNISPLLGKSVRSLNDLDGLKIWVAWREEERNGRLTKVPINPATGGYAKVPTDPATYGTRAQADKRWRLIQKRDPNVKGGTGVVLGKLPNGQYLVGTDLDGCRAMPDFTEPVLKRFNSYTETSPSCQGLKTFFLMSERDKRQLDALLGQDHQGKQLTRKTFSASEHREVAIDTARYYAVTGWRLDAFMHLRLVPFTDVRWFFDEVGPSYLKLFQGRARPMSAEERRSLGKNPRPTRRSNSSRIQGELPSTGIRKVFEEYAAENVKQLDNSGSGYGFRFTQDCHAEGMSFEQACEAIKADGGEAGEWAGRVDERQLERAWKNSEPKDEPTLSAEKLFDPWARFVVPDFPLDVLPTVVQEFVVSQAEVVGVDRASMAMCVLSTFSGALSHSIKLKMMRHGEWYVSPRLWVLLYGDASTKKTPSINAATKPLDEYQKKLQLEYKDRLRYHELSCAMTGRGEERPEKPDPPSRFVVYDTTIEKLGEILTRSERGLLVKRDEFAGWIGSMEKYSGGGASANRAFWLQAFDGVPYVVDRIGRGELFIANLSVSLFGGVQPERLGELHGLTSDGLLQRFIPIVMGAAQLPIDRPSDTNAYGSLVHNLIHARDHVLTLSDPALEVMNELRKHLHDLACSAGGLARGFQSFLGKLQGIAGSLALILHLTANPKGGVDVVQRETADGVYRLVVDFILPHALEFYSTAESATGGDRLKKLASWILTNGKDRFVVSDLTSNIADLRGLPLFDVNERVSPLVAAGWLKPIDRGAHSHAWHVNPVVFTQFAERVKDEERRKVELAKLMGSPRKEKT